MGLSDQEFQTQIIDWNNTEKEYPLHLCLHELIVQQALKTPERTAVVSCDGDSLTYGELHSLSTRAAVYLRDQEGVKPHDLVGIRMDRSLDMMVVILAILKCGAAYVALSQELPDERLEYMIETAESHLVISETGMSESLPPGDYTVLKFDQEREKILATPEQDLEIHFDSEKTLTYVLFTSGSTGKPKGVMLPHRALVNFVLSMREAPGITEDDMVLATTTLIFDIHALELYLPLSSGATILLASNEVAHNSFLLNEFFEKYPVTITQATNSTYKWMLNAGWRGKPELKILCGGEPLTSELAERLLQCGSELWNMYGPTETTVWSTIKRITSPEPPILIGKPIANTQIYLLDDECRPLPVGESGNLYIGGKGVALGYIKRPDLNADRFIQNPFNPDDSSDIIYNTGDLARYMPDGNLECLGRSDFQVKINGYRIELGEIEADLNRHPQVKDSVVVVQVDESETQYLIAYLVTVDNQPCDIEAVNKYLEDKLPRYMIPRGYMVLDEFPLTPNMKIDRKALPPYTFNNQEYVKPYTLEQKLLCDIYSELLEIDNVGIKDNFLQLGGDSLKTAQVIDRLHKSGLSLQPEMIFQFDTIEELAAELKPNSAADEVYGGSSMIILKKGGESRRPLFLMHTLPGDLLGYVNLVHNLDHELPVFGVQSPGLSEDGQVPGSVEEMAAQYTDLIQQRQPSGPYMIGGWCFGGAIALEVALQLKARGEEVELLALFDTSAPYPADRKAAYWLGVLSHIGDNFNERFSLLTCHWKQRLIGADEASDNLGMADTGIFARRAVVRSSNWAASVKYRSGYYDGKVTLFATKDMEKSWIDAPSNWKTRAEACEIITVSGDHGSVLKPPHVELLADKLNLLIEELR